jgi:hypothetical protein
MNTSLNELKSFVNKSTEKLKDEAKEYMNELQDKNKLSLLRTHRQQALLKLFDPTHTVANLRVDVDHQLLSFSIHSDIKNEGHRKRIYTFEDLLGYELRRDGELIMVGGFQEATEKNALCTYFPHDDVKRLDLKIFFNDMDLPEIDIIYIDHIVTIDDESYVKALSLAKITIEAMDVILRNNEKKKILKALRDVD